MNENKPLHKDTKIADCLGYTDFMGGYHVGFTKYGVICYELINSRGYLVSLIGVSAVVTKDPRIGRKRLSSVLRSINLKFEITYAESPYVKTDLEPYTTLIEHVTSQSTILANRKNGIIVYTTNRGVIRLDRRGKQLTYTPHNPDEAGAITTYHTVRDQQLALLGLLQLNKRD